MKKFVAFAVAAMFALGAISCSHKNDPDGGLTEDETYVFDRDGGFVSCNRILFDASGNAAPNGNVIGNGDQNFVFTGKQTIKKGTYILKGWVYIANGAELTIEPGTVIKGDKLTQAALIAERGGKLIAQGSQSQPIVFTSNQPKGSRKPGDWGGLIMCGKAPNNQNNVEGMMIEGGPRSTHGGSDPNDNSGILSYVRVEFAGYPFQTDKEINGITFGSIGRGTQVDHLQVSFSNDDSYEWFGGTVNCKYLVAYKGWDDEFDTDNGFSGNVQFCLSVRDPKIADVSQSNGFESDNCADGSAVEPFTTAVFSNITFIGPRVNADYRNSESYSGGKYATDFINGGSYNPNNGSSLGYFQSAMQVRRSSRLSCFNSLAVGYPIGLIIDGEKGGTVSSANDGKLKLQNIWFSEMTILGSDANKRYADDLYDAAKKTLIDAAQESNSSKFFMAQKGNAVKSLEELLLVDELNVGASYKPSGTSPLLNAADFSDALLTNGFDKVNYIGAFGNTGNWMEGWTNFDPNNTDY